MIELTSEQQSTAGKNMADVFAQALADMPLEQVMAADDVLPTPSAPQAPLSTTTAAAAAPAPVAPPAPPVAPTPTEPPTIEAPPPAEPPPAPVPELPGVMRQVQEITGLLAQSTPEAAEAFLTSLMQINQPLAEHLVGSLKGYLDTQQPAQPPVAAELPPVQFDFGSRSQDDYDEQTWSDFQVAKSDIDAARNSATYWQQRALQAEQSLSEQPAPQPPPMPEFFDARAQAITNALAAVPALAENETAYKMVHNGLLAELQNSPQFVEGVKAAKSGNQLGAYQAGLMVDQLINSYVVNAAKQFTPTVVPPSAAPPAPVSAPVAAPTSAPVPVGAPAMSTAIPPAQPAPGASFVDGLLANISQLEQTGAAPWAFQQ